MKKLATLLIAILAGGLILAPQLALAQTATTVTGAASGIFPSGASFGGVPLNALKVGIGVTISSAGSAEGQLQTTLIGVSALGLAQNIEVVGKATAGSLSAANIATFSGACSIDLGDGTLPLSGIPFTAVIATDDAGMGSLTLTLGTTNLPAATMNQGSMTIQ